MQVVFLHGWGVRDPDYGVLPDWLQERLGARVRDLWLSEYVSYSDEVRMGDLADAFERARLQSMPGERFCCVTHSTGGPVMREWLARYGQEELLTHLVMLAPPNHGSALAQLGKGRLSRMTMWLGHREPGEQLLNWLEPASAESWDLNRAHVERPPSTFLFSLTGSSIEPKFYDHLNSYTGERGSDGVVRAASANLNYSMVELGQAGPALELRRSERSAPAAFGILAGLSHCGTRSGILSSITRENAAEHPAARWVERCLRVEDRDGYDLLAAELAGLNTVASDQGSLLAFRVKDSRGRPIENYDLLLTAGPDYSPDGLPKGFFLDRQRNSVSPSALTYYLDHKVFAQTRELGFRISARPGAGPVNYRASEFRSQEATVASVLGPHETTYVDIRLERRLEPVVFRLRKAA
jgi:hypothetical protein